MNIKFFSIAALLLLLLSLNSYADDPTDSGLTCGLATPALWPVAPNVFTCSLTNTSFHDHKIRIRIINGNGKVLNDSHKIFLGGKHTKGLDVVGTSAGGYMYCEFSMDGHKDEYRGVAKMYHADGNDFIAVPAE